MPDRIRRSRRITVLTLAAAAFSTMAFAGRRADEKLPSAEIIRLVDLRAPRERLNVGVIR